MILFEHDCFYLETQNTSYIMRVLDGGILSNMYYGKKVGRYDMKPFSTVRGMGYSPLTAVDGRNVSYSSISWEMPTFGTDQCKNWIGLRTKEN